MIFSPQTYIFQNFIEFLGIETLTSSPTPSSSYSQRTRVANQTVCKFVFSDVPNPQILKEFSGRGFESNFHSKSYILGLTILGRTLTCKLCLQSYSDLREFNLHVYDVRIFLMLQILIMLSDAFNMISIFVHFTASESLHEFTRQMVLPRVQKM